MELLLSENSYLHALKESEKLKPKNILTTPLDFSLNENYTGEESIYELLVANGVQMDVLEEGALAMPINKLKGVVAKATADSGTVEGIKKTVSSYGGLARAVKPEAIKNQAMALAQTKGISDKEVLDTFNQVTRFLSLVTVGGQVISNPIAWVVIIIALIKSGDLDTFKKQFKATLNELNKGIQRKDSKFEGSLEMLSTAWKLLLICFIPPWIQIVILSPLAGLYAFVGLIHFAIDFLNQFGDEAKK